MVFKLCSRELQGSVQKIPRLSVSSRHSKISLKVKIFVLSIAAGKLYGIKKVPLLKKKKKSLKTII